MAKDGVNRSINLHQPSVFGRIGTGLGRGLSETLPKEIERERLASGLKDLGDKKGLSAFQQFAGLASTPGITPQMIESGTNLLRQQAIINSINQQNEPPPRSQPFNVFDQDKKGTPSATTTESTEAALNPYIPPSGPEQEQLARKLMAAEPQVYPTIESARQGVGSQISANVQQSNAKLAKRDLEESVQNAAEAKLRNEIGTVGATLPGTLTSRLQQNAVDDVTSKELSPDQAKVKYGKEADALSKTFANIRSWGNIGLIGNSSKELLTSIKGLQQNAKNGNFQKEAADSMIADNGVTPQFAYATMYPVGDIKPLNDELKKLPNIKPRLEKVSGSPGLAGINLARPNNENQKQLTTDIVPKLAKAMGLEGSPLAVAYELDQKGYDSQIWKDYLLNSDINLSDYQRDELEKPQPGFFGWLNDWWLKSFSGVK
jgi:hypothetical protein